MFEKIGLGATLSMDGKQFVSGVRQPRDELGRFVTAGGSANTMLGKLKINGMGTFRALAGDIQRAKQGMSELSGAMRSGAMATLPLTAGAAVAGKAFVDFQQQMKVVESVGGGTAEEMKLLADRAKVLGATTQFTATEAGQGMENLRRAGFNVQETYEAVGGTLNLAAADSIDLATASDVTAQVLRGMGLEANQAGRVADVLAKASASTNTDVVGLGEAFKYAAAQAHVMGIDLETTTAALGVISDAGIRGSSAGTSFTNMLIKMADPSEKATAFMKKHSLAVQENADGTVNLLATLNKMGPVFKSITSRTERAAIITELFGIRGQKAVSAIDLAITNGKFADLIVQLKEAKGTAQKMAETRLDSFAGQITLLTSALEGFFIESAAPLIVWLQEVIKSDIIPFVSNLTTMMQELWNGINAGDTEELRKKYGDTVVSIALGIADALTKVRETFDAIQAKFKEWGAELESRFGQDGIQKITEWITYLGIMAAVVGPVAIAFLGVAFVITSVVIPVITGLYALITGAAVPVAVAVGAILALYYALRNENETFGEFAVRSWENIKAAALDLWHNVILPFAEGFREAWMVLGPELEATWRESFGVIKEAILDLFRVFGFGIEGATTDWKDMGRITAAVLGGTLDAIITTVKWIVVIGVTLFKVAKAVAMTVVDFLIMPFQWLYQSVDAVGGAFTDMLNGNIIEGFMALGKAILDFVLEPLRLLVRMIVRLADAVSIDVPDAVRDFGNDGFNINMQDVDKPVVSVVKRGAPGFLENPKEVLETQTGIAGDAMTGIGDSVSDGVSKAMEGIMGAKSWMGEKMGELVEETKKAPCVENTTNVNIDGKKVAQSVQRNEQELKDRAGFKQTPWQRRTALEQGAAPVRK